MLQTTISSANDLAIGAPEKTQTEQLVDDQSPTCSRVDV